MKLKILIQSYSNSFQMVRSKNVNGSRFYLSFDYLSYHAKARGNVINIRECIEGTQHPVTWGEVVGYRDENDRGVPDGDPVHS